MEAWILVGKDFGLRTYGCFVSRLLSVCIISIGILTDGFGMAGGGKDINQTR